MSQADKFDYKGLSNVSIAETSQAYAVIFFIPNSKLLHFGCSSYDVQCANLKTRECNISHSLCYWHHWLSCQSLWVHNDPQDMSTVGCFLLRIIFGLYCESLDFVAERLHQLLHLLGSSEDLSSESYTQIASHAEFAAFRALSVHRSDCLLSAGSQSAFMTLHIGARAIWLLSGPLGSDEYEYTRLLPYHYFRPQFRHALKLVNHWAQALRRRHIDGTPSFWFRRAC